VLAGQPLSRDRKLLPGADAVCVAEGNTSKRANASVWAARRGRRTWHARTLLVRDREISGLAIAPRVGWSAAGRRGAVAADARSGEV
jgi:hypothetical protein